MPPQATGGSRPPSRVPRTSPRRPSAGALAIAAWAIAAAALSCLSPVEEAELRALDLQFRSLRGTISAPTDDRVVVVGIDSRSIDSIAEPVGLWHEYLARFLDALVEAPPTVLAFDIVMPDRSFEGIAPGLDRALLRALITSRRAYPTVLAITIKEDGRPRGIHPALIAAAGTTPGFALWPVDPDGRIRRFDEDLGVGHQPVKTLVGEVMRRTGRAATTGYIDYALGRNFDYVPFVDVLAAAERGDREFLKRHFQDRFVILGMVLPFTDSVRVPVGLASWDIPDRETPGVLLHAQAVRAELANRMVSRVEPGVVAALTLAVALLALVATTPLRAAILAGVALAGLPVVSWSLLREARFLPVVWPIVAGLAGIAIRQGVEIAGRLAERRKLRSSFSGYVSPAVMDQIVSGAIRPETDGVNAQVCVLFSDIRGYTTLSEGKAPKEILALLNRYFDRMVAIIHEQEGTVISFMGDGVMAVFGAPKALPNAAEAAFRAAVRMLDGVRDFNRELEAEDIAPIAIGVGMHLGEAVIGHVGSKTRHDFTAIGDVTNVASRLESATKEAGFRIVISREVAEQLADRQGLVELGPVSIKGHTPVEAYGYERAQPPPVGAA